METQLEIFSFAIKSIKIEQPELSDYIKVGVEKNQTNDIKIWFDVKDDNIVVFSSEISIAASVLSRNTPTPDGKFYVFKQRQEFEVVAKNKINQMIVAELCVNHFGLVFPKIMEYGVQIHENHKAIPLEIPSLSKILLWIEELWKN